MTFREVPVGGEFWHDGRHYRKVEQNCAIRICLGRVHFGPLTPVSPVAPPAAEAVTCLEPDGHRPFPHGTWHQSEGGG